MTIILIDNNEKNLCFLENCVANIGLPCDVVKFDNSLNAYDFISLSDEELIIFTEVNLKSLNGLALIKKIKTFGKKLYVAFVTDTKDYAMDAWELSADDYILKPADSNRIKDSVRMGVRKVYG